MDFDVTALSADFRAGLKEMETDYGFSTDGAIKLSAEPGEAGLCRTAGGYRITYRRKCEFYREFLRVLAGETECRETCSFETLGVMADCSRNAVMNVTFAKSYIRTLAGMGFNMLELYTEDTYEIAGEPYFGYMRGRFSAAELKELDAYGRMFGVELVPCIQTLAHLNAITRWPRYAPMIDCNDILLAGDDRTYELVDKMFATLAECFTSRRVNIGMDEAHMLGLGRYLEERGFHNRFEIMADHLKRVLEIADKYGFTCAMWSDMFFRLANKGEYYPQNKDMPSEVVELIPKNVTMIYWDYYHDDKKTYEEMLQAHKRMGNRVMFAGGAWKWHGFAPANTVSMNRTAAAFEACAKYGIEDVMLTAWGDNGAECSLNAILPTLVYAAERAYGNRKPDKAFARVTGVSFRDFMTLELADAVIEERGKFYITNFSKVYLYNDLLSGIFDYTVRPGTKETLAASARRIRSAGKRAGRYAYLFDSLAALTDLVADKCDFGVRARKAYKEGDRDALKVLADEIPRLIRKLDKFYAAYKAQWERDSRPWGFQVQDVRLGGLKQRMLHCREILLDYLDGGRSIPELETEILPAYEYNPEVKPNFIYNSWGGTVTANVL